MTIEGQKMEFTPLRRPDAKYADLDHPDHTARRLAQSASNQGRQSRTPEGLVRSLAARTTDPRPHNVTTDETTRMPHALRALRNLRAGSGGRKGVGVRCAANAPVSACLGH